MIRFLQPDDLVSVHDVDIKCYDAVWNSVRFTQLETYVYLVDSRVVGFITWKLNSLLQVLKLGVTPGFRRQGIGTALLTAVLCRGMITKVPVLDEQVAGQLFLDANEFRHSSTRIVNGITVYMMENLNGFDNWPCCGTDERVEKHGDSMDQ